MSKQPSPPLLNRATRKILRVLLTSKEPVWDKELLTLTQLPYEEITSCLIRLHKKFRWVDFTTQTVMREAADGDSELDRRHLYTLTREGRMWAESILGKQS